MPKSKIENELIKIEQDDKKFIKYPFVFTSSNVDNKNTFFFKSQAPSPICNLQYFKLSQMSGIGVLSKNSSETSELNKTDKKDKRVHFNILNNLKIKDSDNIIPESPDVSFRSASPYCSQTLYEFIRTQNFFSFKNIIQSLVKKSPYSTPQISECSTASLCDTDKTISGLDKNIDYSKLVQNIKQSLQDLNTFSTNSQNKSIATDLDHSVIVKSESMQDKILLSKYEKTTFIVNQQLYEQQFITVLTFASNATKNFNSKQEIRSSQPDSKTTIFKMNMLKSRKINDSNLNFNIFNFPDEITPVANIKIDNKKDENLITTINEIYNTDYNVKEKNIVLEEFSIEGTKNNVTSIITIDISLCSVKNLTSQNVDEQYMIDYIYNNSLINATTQKSANLSLQFTKQKSLHSLKMRNSEFYDYKSIEKHFYKNKSQIMSSIVSQNIENNLKEIFSQSTLPSLPLSEDNVEYMLLPSCIFLSNYCSEYDKAYTKKDLKPTSYRNYYSNKIVDSLKKHFDEVITPEKCLEVFFKADNVSEKFEVALDEIVNKILLILENTLDENC